MVTRSHYAYTTHKPFYSEHRVSSLGPLHSLSGRSEIQFILSVYIYVHTHTYTHVYIGLSILPPSSK